MIRMPSDGEITFADHAGRFYARRFGMAPMVGRLIGYLAVCDPREQSISELADALLASRSAIAGAVNALENLGLIQRSRAAGERMDRVRIDMSSSHAMGFDVSEYREMAELAREGLRLLAEAPPERRAILLEWAAFSDFLVGRLPVLEQEWKSTREALRAAGELPDDPSHTARREKAMTSVSAASGIVAQDVCKSFGDHLVLDKVSLAVEEGTILALLGPNGAGKTTMVRILSTLIPADSGSMRIAGHDVVTDPDGVRAVIGVTGQFSAVDNLLTGAENLQLMADLRHLGREAGRRRVAELLEQFDLTDAARQAAFDLLRRDATTARPGDDPGRQAPGDLPRRADHRLGPAQPPHHVADHPRARRGRGHHPAHHPVPRRGRPAGRPDRGARPGPDRRRRDPRRAEEPHPRRPRPAALRRSRTCCTRRPSSSRRLLPTRTSSSSRSPPTAPSTRSGACSTSCTKPVSTSSGCRSTPRTSTTCSSPSPAATSPRSSDGRPRTTRSTAVMTTLAYTLSDSRVMLRRNLKHQLRYPSMTVMLIGMPIVLLLLFVYVFGGQLGAGLGAHEGRSAYLNYVVPGLLLLTVASAIQGTSIMVAMDMTGGIIDRFRTMAIARASVLTGHVLGSLIQTLVASPSSSASPSDSGSALPPDRSTGWPRSGSWPCSPSR